MNIFEALEKDLDRKTRERNKRRIEREKAKGCKGREKLYTIVLTQTIEVKANNLDEAKKIATKKKGKKRVLKVYRSVA